MLGNLPQRRREDRPHRFRRGVYLLPSLFTVANLFCGYACVVYATRADFDTAALFIGIAMVLDTLDGLIARLTNSTSAFGVQLDSLADVVSFGMAPAILAFTWGLWPLKRLGWAAGFIYVTAAAMRLARFNIQTTTAADKRHFVGLPSPAAGAVIASTVYLWPGRAAGAAGGAAGAGDGPGPGVPDGQHHPLPQRQGDRHGLAAVRTWRCSWRGGDRADRLASAAGAGDHVVHLRAFAFLMWAAHARRPGVQRSTRPGSKNRTAGRSE